MDRELYIKLAIAGVIVAPFLLGFIAGYIEKRDCIPNANGLVYGVVTIACSAAVYIGLDFIRGTHPGWLPVAIGPKLSDDPLTGFSILIGIGVMTPVAFLVFFAEELLRKLKASRFSLA